jgi:hypothetical protein
MVEAGEENRHRRPRGSAAAESITLAARTEPSRCAMSMIDSDHIVRVEEKYWDRENHKEDKRFRRAECDMWENRMTRDRFCLPPVPHVLLVKNLLVNVAVVRTRRQDATISPKEPKSIHCSSL